MLILYFIVGNTSSLENEFLKIEWTSNFDFSEPKSMYTICREILFFNDAKSFLPSDNMIDL